MNGVGDDRTERPYPGLLVDWGGVLTTNVFASFAAFGEREGIGGNTVAALFRADFRARRLLAGLETGSLTEHEFEHEFGAVLGVPPAGLISRLMADVHIDPRMCAAVAAARNAGVATGLVSNSWGTDGYPADLVKELFAGVVISGEVGFRKPSREIYELGALAIGLTPRQCVFVDDLRGNLAQPWEMGMATVHHTDPEKTIATLSRLLGVDLGQPSQPSQTSDIPRAREASDASETLRPLGNDATGATTGKSP